jgi:hypothetical protein
MDVKIERGGVLTVVDDVHSDWPSTIMCVDAEH